MTHTKESIKGLDTSTRDKEVSWWGKIKDGLKQGEVKWAIGSGVCFLFLRILLAALSKTQNIDFAYYLIVLGMYVIYFYVFLACFIPITKEIAFLLICFFSLSSLVFSFFSIHAVYAVVLALATAPIMPFLCKMLTRRKLGRTVLGNFLLLGLIAFVLWQIFIPDSNENALNINCSVDIFEGGETPNKAIVSSTPFVLENRAVLIVSLGVFIYTAFLCTAIRSRLRWVLYCAAGSIVFFTVVSYYQESAPVIQISVFLLFLVIFCSFLPFIADDIEKEYPEVSEQLGRIRAYNRFHAWIRRSLKEGEGKAALLLGGWGVGKTHCLKYLSHRLSLKQPYNDGGIKGRYDKRQYDDDFDKDNAFMGKVKICMVNLWEYSSREEAWNAIAQALGRTILGRYSFLNSITLNKYLPRIMRSLPSGNIFSNLYELFFWGDSDRDEALCEQLSDDIRYNERIVLILDDIERTDFQIIKALPPLIEKLRKIERLMVICSLAKDELAKVHKKELITEDSEGLALETLTGYLTKIFDYTFSLPNLSMYKRNTYIDERLRKYSDCKLTCKYLKQSGLNFVTPRQIERAIDELGELERQFFYDSDNEELTNEEFMTWRYAGLAGHNALYAYYSCTVFLVEIIQSFYPQFFSIAQGNSEGLVEFAQRVNHMAESHKKPGQGGTERQEEKKEESGEIQYIHDLIQTDYFAADLIKALEDCKEENVRRAVEGEYRRRIVLTTHECEKLYTVLNKEPQMTLLDGLKKIFGGEESIPEDINASGLEFFDYVTERVFDEGTDYAKMLLRLIPQGHFERDKGIKPVSSSEQVFTWSIDHFFYLLYLYTEKAPKDKPLAERLKNVVIQMFDRASILTKFSILHSFFHYQKEELPQLKDEIEHSIDYKSISVRIVNENGVTEELFKCYVKRYIQGVLKSEISKNVICNNYYGISKFLMLLVERKDYADILSAEFIANDIEGIRNSMDVLTLPCVCQDHSMEPPIMMSSKRMVDLILPILQRGFDIYGVNAVTSDQIDDWIKNCNASIEYWSKDQTKLNKQCNYTVGAEKVKEFLEDLKARKESPVENEEGKISE